MKARKFEYRVLSAFPNTGGISVSGYTLTKRSCTFILLKEVFSPLCSASTKDILLIKFCQHEVKNLFLDWKFIMKINIRFDRTKIEIEENSTLYDLINLKKWLFVPKSIKIDEVLIDEKEAKCRIL